MKSVVCLCIVVGVVACHADIDPPEATMMFKASPSAVSATGAWSLFDRSVSSVFTPDEKPVGVDFDEAESIAALKVYGPAPFKLDVRSRDGGSLGFEQLDLSSLDPGWHTFASNVITSTNHVDLAFHPDGKPGAVPEIEVWAQTQHLPPARGSVDLTTSELPVGYVKLPATSPSDELDANNCVEFALQVPRSPALFRAAHVVYEAKGVFRSFSLVRSVNGLGQTGGAWVAGSNDATTIVDRIDPSQLHLGDNTIRFCAPEASDRVTLSNVRLVGELDTGTSLADSVSVGTRDGEQVIDGDSNTSIDVAAGEHLAVQFERSIAADMVSLVGSNLVSPSVACVKSASLTRSVDAHYQPTSGAALIGLEGASSCTALDLTFPSSVTLSAIDVVGSGAGDAVDWAHIVVTSAPEHFGTKAWVGGFVARPRAMTGAIRIEVADQTAPSKAGDFGQLLLRSEAASTWSVTVTAHLPDGTTRTRQVLLGRDQRAQLDKANAAAQVKDSPIVPDTRFGRVGEKVVVRAVTGASTKVRLGTSVGLDVPPGALRQPTDIAIKHLSQSELPPLEPGMVNVTAPKDRGYEFLPHGQKFVKPIDVMVPYDPTLIPSEMSVDKVHTFYFDVQDNKWKQLTRTAVDIAEHVTHSATDHFTIMIDAVLAEPKNPTPMSFDPTAMSSIAGATPADNMDLIAPPEASSTGDAHVALPIRIPPGRGAFTPSMSIAYSSAGSNGWLGVGWDLAISHIEIDTRWGVPSYEHEPRYILDGAEVIPTSETEGPLCQNGSQGHRYRSRVEGAFAHIIRCETGSGMHFELHDRNGTLFVYGDDPAVDSPADPHHASVADPLDATHISRWQLSKVVDVHGNATVFHYFVDNTALAPHGVDAGFEIYPSSIAYTSGGTTTAAYTIEFGLDDGARPDVVTSGRSGFKLATRRLLRAIHVAYRGQTIRDYVLTYQHGQFQKTTLAKVQLYGTGGCSPAQNAFTTPSCSAANLFNQHTFEYFQESEAFGPSTHLFMAGTDDAQRMPLTSALTDTTSGALYASANILHDLSASLGGSVQTSSRDEKLGLYDINGDGLADQVYLDGNSITALYNQNVPGVDPASHLLFAPDATKSIVGLSFLGNEGSSNWGENVGVSLGVVSLNGAYSNTSSSSMRRLVDIDGDGYVDSLGGYSWFGQPCPQGTCFSQAAFGAVNGIDPFQDPMLQALAGNVSERLMLADPVVNWTAPMSGCIAVSGVARKLSAGGADGVSLQLFQGSNAMGSPLAIGAFDIIAHDLPSSEVFVSAGDTISLRLSTGADDAIGPDGTPLDLVSANVHLVYEKLPDCNGTPVANPTQRDSSGALLYTYDSRNDFRVAGTPTFIIAPVAGKLQLHAVLTKGATPGDVTACIQKFTAPDADVELALDVTCAQNNVNGTWTRVANDLTPVAIDTTPSMSVGAGDIVLLRIESPFSLDPISITLQPGSAAPYFSYTEVDIPNADTNSEDIITDQATLDSIRLSAGATTDFGPYIALTPPATSGFVAPMDTTLTFDAIDPGNSFVLVSGDQSGPLYYQDCTFGTCGSLLMPPITAAAGETIYVELASQTPIAVPDVAGTYGGNLPFSLHVTTHAFGDSINGGHSPFAGGYHGWRSGLWNDAEAFDPEWLIAQYDNWSGLSDADKAKVARTAVPPLASFGHNAAIGPIVGWVGPGSVAYVGQGRLNAGHLGLIADGGSAGGGGGVFRGGYGRMSTTTSKTLDGGVHLTEATGVFGVIVNGQSVKVEVGNSDTVTSADTLDLDGDGVLDTLANSTLSIGDLSDSTTGRRHIDGWGPAAFRKRHGFDYSLDVGESVMRPVVAASGRTLFDDTETTTTEGLGFDREIGFGVSRSETTNDLIDVNGDGLPDQIERDGANLTVRLNLGSRFDAPEPYGSIDPSLMPNVYPIDQFQSKEGSAAWLALGVISPDTTTNALVHDTTITQQTIDSESVFFATSTKTRTMSSTRTTRTIADINGDGLPDLVVKIPLGPDGGQAPFKVQYNLGTGFGPAISWGTPPWDVVLAPTFDSKLNPFNVVGPDVIAGTGTDSSATHGTSLSIPIPGTPFTIGGSFSTSIVNDSFELQLFDIDGDGSPDHVLRRTTSLTGGTPTAYVKFNQVTGRANLLKKVTRPLGATFTLDYARKGNTVDMPHSRQVLARVEVDDGVDLGASFPSPNLVTTFAYDQGRYQRNEKEFYGFGKVTTSRPDGVTVEDDFDTSTVALHGRLLKEIKRDAASTLLHEHDIGYQLLDVFDANNNIVTGDIGCTDDLPALLRREASVCTPTFPVVVSDSETRSEGGVATKSHLVTDLASDHDRFGNVLASTDNGDDAIATDDIYTQATYQNDTSKWILGRATSLTVRAGSSGGSVLRSRTGEFNGAGELIALHVDTGSGIATTTIGYDNYGNLNHITSPPNEASQTQSYDVTYDADVETYPITTVDGFGYTSHATYDVRFAVAVNETDVNNQQLVRGLDAFGRLVQTRSPYDSTSTGLVNIYNTNQVPSGVTTGISPAMPAGTTATLPPATVTATWFDGLGRVLEQRKTAVVGSATGIVTTGLAGWDSIGRITKTQNPFFSTGTYGFITPVSTLSTRVGYDTMDRAISTVYPDGNSETVSYDISAAPDGTQLFHTHAIDANGHARDAYGDFNGHVRASIEHPTTTTSSTTTYGYLATGELSAITDAEGNQSSLTYDLRGMRTSMTNPDTGLIETHYDLMGNRIALIEPNHRALHTQIHYVFDRNRLEVVDYPQKPDVTYTYGSPGASNNGAGRVVALSDETGAQSFEYGALGETRRVLRTVTDTTVNPHGTFTFDTRTVSDSVGRLLQTTYPDGEVVSNTYNAGGVLQQVTGTGSSWSRAYVSNLQYDEFGHRTYAKFGNNDASTWVFDPARVRLSSLVTTLAGTSTRIQDLHYGYDAVGNPISIANNLPASPVNNSLPGTATQSFGYDGADQLTGANGHATLGNGNSWYNASLSYTPSHNIASKYLTDVRFVNGVSVSSPTNNYNATYTYTSGKPHLPSTIGYFPSTEGSLQITYDPSGNPITRTNGTPENLTWDDDNRLIQVSGGGISQLDQYDATGLRVVRNGSSHTIFANSLFEFNTQTTGTKHIFAGAQHVASVLNTFASGANPAAPTGTGTAYYVHENHLGSVAVVTTTAVNIHNPAHVNDAHEYFPDGAAWVDSGAANSIDGHLFSGKPFDSDTGFYDFGQRFYDPRTSLWLGIDGPLRDAPARAVGAAMMLAPSVFAAQNPLTMTDRDGRDAKTVQGKVLRAESMALYGGVDSKGFNYDTLAARGTGAEAAAGASLASIGTPGCSWACAALKTANRVSYDLPVVGGLRNIADGHVAKGLAQLGLDAITLGGDGLASAGINEGINLGTDVAGDVAIEELAPTAPKRLTPGLNLPSRQFGKKVAQHAPEFGLDATTAEGRSAFRERIESVVGQYEELRQGAFQGGRTDVLFYRKGSDLVLTTPSGEFITIFSNGATNSWFLGANQLYP
ncbi:MAG: SpvB/TcaC N-terminal domain-containing protein [Deltaproteobacteria bacterium]